MFEVNVRFELFVRKLDVSSTNLRRTDKIIQPVLVRDLECLISTNNTSINQKIYSDRIV